MPRWTKESRQRQAELIRTWQPWQNSTGPTSKEGKKRSSKNARLKGDRLKLRQTMNELKQFSGIYCRASRKLDRAMKAMLNRRFKL